MKLAIMSDIHGNLEAFQEVLADMDEQGVEDVVCLGDCVGYGPDSDKVLDLLWSRRIPSVLGNHEEAIFSDEILNWFNPQARETVLKIRSQIPSDAVDRLKQWPTHLVFHDAWCVHGFPPDSVHTYLFQATNADIAESFANIEQQIIFVGHTHTLELVAFDGERVDSYGLEDGLVLLDERRYIVNVGSVGQPRDGNNNAKYVIWDEGLHHLEVRFVPYDIGATVDKIMSLGFPEVNARRLW
ncbi:MAG: metallophosphoesterase family protein [Desulfatibacillaceae bacterium]